MEGTPVPVTIGGTGSCTQEYPRAVYCPSGTPLDSGMLKAGGTFAYTFTKPGVYEYFDVNNGYELNVGFVVVK